MAGDIEVVFDKRQLRQARQMLAAIPNGWPKAASWAINSTARTLRSRIVKRISRESGIQQKVVREQVKLSKATRYRLMATVKLMFGRLRLIDLGARQTKKGVTYRAGQGRRKLVAHAFIERMPSGREGAFKRLDLSRLPIKELFGPSIAGVFVRAKAIERETLQEGAELLERNLWQKISALLEQRGIAA